MATVNRQVFYSEEQPTFGSRQSPMPIDTESRNGKGDAKRPRMHRIAAVRKQQGISLRTAARQMNTDVRGVRTSEDATNDMRLSELYEWQRVLGVPVVDLLETPDSNLSGPVLERAQLIRIMKSVKALQEIVRRPAAQRMCDTLVAQMVEVMPELQDVSAWHHVGHRRSLGEYGRAAERVVADEMFQ